MLFKTMKIRTIFHLFLLCIVLNSTACKSAGPGSTPGSVEEAEAQIAKKRAKQEKASRREMKKIKKAYWKRQSPAARKSVKRNEKNQKKIARRKRHQEKRDWEEQERWEK
jgi:sRNA-binding protein